MLLEKHIKTFKAPNKIFTDENIRDGHLATQNRIYSDMVREAIKKTRDTDGYSGIDVDSWSQIPA